LSATQITPSKHRTIQKKTGLLDCLNVEAIDGLSSGMQAGFDSTAAYYLPSANDPNDSTFLCLSGWNFQNLFQRCALQKFFW